MAETNQQSFRITLAPYLCVHDAAGALEFYKKAFGATETIRLAGPDGRIGHAEIRIGDVIVMLADEFPEIGVVSPRTLGGTPVTLTMDVQDADATVHQAISAGATELRPLKDQFYGRRSGKIQDPFGHRWDIGMIIEDVSPEEIQRRAAAACGGKK